MITEQTSVIHPKKSVEPVEKRATDTAPITMPARSSAIHTALDRLMR
jgi:hypothetical protein